MRFPLLLLALFAVSCNSNSSEEAVEKVDTLTAAEVVPQDVKDLDSLNRLLGKNAAPSVFYNVSAKTPSSVTGKSGIVIKIDPGALETTDGSPLAATIAVELKEALNQEHFLKNDVNTVSDGRLLVSGGAYYVNLSSGGKQLRLKSGQGLKMQVPRLTEKDMELFYGERDGSGNMNWKTASQKFVPQAPPVAELVQPRQGPDTVRIANQTTLKTGPIDVGQFKSLDQLVIDDKTFDEADKISKENKKVDSAISSVSVAATYDEMDIRKLGWINCDRFLQSNNLIPFMYTFNPSDSIKAAKVYLVFRDINSVMSQSYRSAYPDNYLSIPSRSRIILIAVGLRKGQLAASRTEVVAEAGKTTILAMKDLKESDLQSLFKYQ
jgi:hypothetical protein